MNTDPIADLLTRIRNAGSAGHKHVEIPFSNRKLDIVKLLAEEGYIRSYETKADERGFQTIRVLVKYDSEGYPAIRRLKRISRPGLRIYSKVDKIPRVLNGAGVVVLSTPRGIMTDRKARRENVGGELLFTVQ